jgi:hypothetical protein
MMEKNVYAATSHFNAQARTTGQHVGSSVDGSQLQLGGGSLNFGKGIYHTASLTASPSPSRRKNGILKDRKAHISSPFTERATVLSQSTLNICGR